jgi:hypothetical protein
MASCALFWARCVSVSWLGSAGAGTHSHPQLSLTLPLRSSSSHTLTQCPHPAAAGSNATTDWSTAVQIPRLLFQFYHQFSQLQSPPLSPLSPLFSSPAMAMLMIMTPHFDSL